jgi:purine-nucleoside phosphorylase
MAPTLFERVDEAAAVLGAQCDARPIVAVALGSGLGDVADLIANPTVIDYAHLPHWPRAGVEGHRGTLSIGRLAGCPVAILSGRVHVYEGRSFDDVVFAARVMGRLGVKHIVLTNAAGGINPTFGAGTIMVIDDHLNLLGGSPLTGDNEPRFGPRFPDMTEVYSRRLRALADTASADLRLPIAHGVYAAVHGPSYETPAEVRYLRTIGADAVGMSTVAEAIAARHMGMEVLGISCITNRAAGAGVDVASPLTHDDVLATARATSGGITSLLRAIIPMMQQER